MNFDKYKNDGNRFVRELSIELGYPRETERTGRILIAVLHTLRDHLSVDQSLRILSLMPMFLKGIYVDGWENTKKKEITQLNDFLKEIWRQEEFKDENDFENIAETEHALVMVFHVLRKYISSEDLHKIAEILPEKIQPLFKPVYVV